jgi:hypothetical protein
VYPDVRGTSHDVVKGVIFYFALLLPFVIFAERLLINYVDIRKKLAAIAGLFALSYVVLMFVHPAFRLSQAPIIILDGFFMMVASSESTTTSARSSPPWRPPRQLAGWSPSAGRTAGEQDACVGKNEGPRRNSLYKSSSGWHAIQRSEGRVLRSHHALRSLGRVTQLVKLLVRGDSALIPAYAS